MLYYLILKTVVLFESNEAESAQDDQAMTHL